MNEKKNSEELRGQADTERMCREEKLSELEIMRQSVEEQKKKALDFYEQILRLKADFENYRKRVEREKIGYFEDGKNSLILEIIDIFETVKTAKQMIEKSDNSESVHKGLHLIEVKLSETLKKHDVTPLKTVGEKYNPHFHEVVGIIENDNVEEDVILEEAKAGYNIGERVLKPAMVKIAKKTKKSNNNTGAK